MVKVYSIDGLTPVVHPDAYVHPSAVLIGDVHVGAGVYIGPSASLRGDFGRMVVEAGANIQDCCILHGFPESDTVIEQDGHIGHGAIIHSARICRNAMVGMNAVVRASAPTSALQLLPDHISGRGQGLPVLEHRPDASLFDIIEECERRIIGDMLEKCNGNQTEAAERFHIPLSTLNQKIKRLSIEIRKRNRE